MLKKSFTSLSLLKQLLSDRTKTIGDLIQFLNNCPSSNQMLLSASECAEILDLSRSQVYKLLRQGKLTGFKIKNLYWRIKFQHIEDYLQKYRQPGTKSKRNPLTFLNGGCI